MKIGLLGYGTVGKGIKQLIDQHPEYGMSIAYILRSQKAFCNQPEMVADFDVILQDEQVDTIVECIGGLHPSYEYVKAALLKGKHVVSANKKMLAKYYQSLMEISKENQVQLRFAASVGGGISWLEMLYDLKRQERIDSFCGIMNGTSNYILDCMLEKGIGFEDSLKVAQQKGFAEANPLDDLSGLDTANKTVLSANVAYDGIFDVDDLLISGIEHLSSHEIRYAQSHCCRIGLVGRTVRHLQEVGLAVYPCFIPKGNQLYSIKENYNCFEVNSFSMQHAAIMGQGAGQFPTAKNVIADLLKIKDRQLFQLTGCSKENHDEWIKQRFYLRTVDYQTFAEVIETQIDATCFITKELSVKQLRALCRKCQDQQLFIAGV